MQKMSIVVVTIQVMFALLVVLGQTPQLTAVTLYSTSGQTDCTGSQVKTRLFVVTPER